MTFLFPSNEWLDSLVDLLNNSEDYQKAAENWEGDFYFIIEPDDSFQERVIAYMDLWHGKCRSGCIVSDETAKNPEFRIRAPFNKWRKVLEKKLNPIQGMLTGQLKVSGNMMKIVKNPKAAIELVNCCSCVPTIYPS